MMPEVRVAPPITETEAAELAREIYNLDARASRLPGEYDDNFRLSVTDGSEFVLKVMHAARKRPFLELQCAALEHLRRRAPSHPLPRVRPARMGEPFVQRTFAEDAVRFVWLLSYLPGAPLAKAKPHSSGLLTALGKVLGELDAALSDFLHPAVHRDLKWDLARAGWIRSYLHHLSIPTRRALVEKFLNLYESEVVPVLRSLRRSVIYGDANDYNVLVSPPWPQPRKIAGLVDFGDMHFSITVSELAIAAAYAILAKDDPLQAASQLVLGYHAAFPLTEGELAVLYVLIGARLAVSVTNSAYRKTLVAGDPYVTVSETPAWDALAKWANVHPRFAHYTFREACQFAPVPRSEKVQRWLGSQAQSAASLLETDLRISPCPVLDLSIGSAFPSVDPRAAEAASLSEAISCKLKSSNASVAIGRYDEARLLYSSPLFGSSANPTDERRTVHLGLDLFAAPGTAIHAPLDGVVHKTAVQAAPQDYGPLVILRHETTDATEFFTLYGHLSRDACHQLQPGQHIARGQPFARIGTLQENGGWAPHLHFQIILDLLDLDTDFPGVARASQRTVWTALSPDPNLLLGIPKNRFPEAQPGAAETLASRRALLGKNLSVCYDSPLKIVRGWRQYLYDDTGRAFLDVYNNVPLVGHCHPRVVRAAQEQLALLNTNTRYLHDNVNRYAERLTELLPAPLRVCYFVNSGSEANELALRLARAHTRREDVVVLEHAYHGHTSTLIDISPYKFNGPGGEGKKPWVHVAPIPDDYRGLYRRDDPHAGAKYAQHVAEIFAALGKEDRAVAAYIAETLPSVAGQIVFPPGYLAKTYEHVRASGGVCVADEVQVGFGRLGSHFWGFATQAVIPDILVLGKPIGNAFPLAAVVTTPAIAASFHNGMEFFSTFGGNPVACAAGLAVLDVLRDERLQNNALEVGNYLISRLQSLQERHTLIGDVRGSGLFLGLDLVLDRETRAPAPNQARYIVNRLRDRGILTGTDGPHHNVIKLRPPLIFSAADAKLFTGTLDEVLSEDAAQASQLY